MMCPAQSDDNVAFDEIPVFGIFGPTCHDSSLYISLPWFFLHDAVMLPQVSIRSLQCVLSGHCKR